MALITIQVMFRNKFSIRDHSIGYATAAYVIFLLACILSYAIDYITNVIQVESFSQFLYTMQVGMGGAGNTVMQILQGFAMSCGVLIAFATLLYVLVVWLCRQTKKEHGAEKKGSSHKSLQTKALVTLNCGCLLSAAGGAGQFVSRINDGYSALKIDSYLEEQQTYSRLYEDHYVQPASDMIHAPKKKKNLIYIYMESMESTFSDVEHGGGFQENLIPNLTRLAMENNDFSNADDDSLNGGRVTSQTSWTVAGMTAQTSGTPLGVSNSQYNHSFEEDMLFLPNVVTLGDLLEDQGYTNMLMCGSEASYAGRSNYFRQHGNYEIFDVLTAREEGYIPEDYNEWWGFEDAKLVEFAKEKITELASKDEPFNFTMLTADTHFKDGYLCPDCKDEFDEQYENAIRCSDKRISEFVSWIQQQPFYKDTVIVLSGDHLSMDSLISQSVGLDFPRRTYFTVINGRRYTLDQRRDYATLDIFPTTLEAMGFDIDGHRLGLGTSLYSSEPTLVESVGFEALNQQISYRSERYENEILKDDGYTPGQDSENGELPFGFSEAESMSRAQKESEEKQRPETE